MPVLKEKLAVLDVRTSEEHVRGHIPGSINLELFNSEERAQVGKMYKKCGQDDAVKLGFDFISPKIDDLLSEIEDSVTTDSLLIHCWRGGMRSESLAWLISFALNKDVYILDGGYKSYRQYVIETFTLPFQFSIVGGYTGSGKTDVLKELETFDQQVLDLEDLAKHRGSAFGGIELDPQPSQQSFENLLAEQLRTLDPQRTIWLEDESKRIGSRTIPDVMFKKMKSSPLFFLNIPFNLRAEYINNSYGNFEVDSLIGSTEKLSRRLGLEKMNHVIGLLQSGDIRAASDILLRYYDKSYDHGLSKKVDGQLSKLDIEKIDPRSIAKKLISLSKLDKS